MIAHRQLWDVFYKYAWARYYLAQSVLGVVWQKSILTQARQLILYISNSEQQVDDFVGELTH